MSSLYLPQPNRMAIVPGQPAWDALRLNRVQSTIDRITHSRDFSSRTLVQQFVSTLQHELTTRICGHDRERIEERRASDPRLSIQRALIYLQSVLKPPTTRIGSVEFAAWQPFIVKEAEFMEFQAVCLWIDLLAHARMHRTHPSDPIPLTDRLLPEGNTPILGDSPPERTNTLREGAPWRGEFDRLLTCTCCVHTSGLQRLTVMLESGIKHRLAELSGNWMVIDLANGRFLRISRTDGGYFIDPISRDERTSWGSMSAPIVPITPAAKQPMWSCVCTRLHAIAFQAQSLRDGKDDDPNLHALRTRAEELIDLLCESSDIPSSAASKIEIALRSMADLLPEYEDDWRIDILDQIFTTTR